MEGEAPQRRWDRSIFIRHPPAMPIPSAGQARKRVDRNGAVFFNEYQVLDTHRRFPALSSMKFLAPLTVLQVVGSVGSLLSAAKKTYL
jgi:hypothetical protein